MEYSNGTAEAYRYHHAPTSYETTTFVGQANTYCGTNNLLPPPPSTEEFHSSTSRRFHPYLSDPSVVTGNAPPVDNGLGHYRSGYPTAGSHQCEQCGAVFDSPHGLSEHIQTHHYSATTFPDAYSLPSSSHIKTELNGGGGGGSGGGGTNETAEILDLDSHKVHVYQPPGNGMVVGLVPGHHPPGSLAPTPPYTPATSVGSNSSSMGWMTPTPPLPSLAPPPPLHPHDYRPNPYPAYDLPMPVNGGVVANGNNTMPVAKPTTPSWKPNPPSNGGPPPGGGGGGGGNHGGGSEARRPKTYNCEACNKWFTSSGHLKRHYNTTLHKNAIKASGGSSNGGSSNGGTATNGSAAANGEGHRSTTPSSRSTGTPTVNSPAGSDETSKTMDDLTVSRSSVASPKMIPSSPSNGGDYRPPSQQPPPPLIHHHQQQQQTIQNGPLPQLVPVNGYSSQQQQQQPNSMEVYRLSYPAPAPNGNNPPTMMSSGPMPSTGHLPYYCPPPVGHSSYSPYPQQHQQQQQQQHHHLQQQQQQHPQQQQQHLYSPSNTMGYPPNSIAPPPSSNANVKQLGVGPTASSHGVIHQQHFHLNHEQPFINNNNSIIPEQHKIIGINGGGGVEFNGQEPDSFHMKTNESDCSAGSEGSPAAASDDPDLDMSDAEEEPQRSVPVTVGKANGAAKSRPTIAVANDATGTASVGSFKCTQCDKAFNRVCYLTQHNNTFHKGDKPFKCHMCGKRFPNAELFDQHQQKHAGDKPYKCPLCPKQFNHKTDLRRHMCLHTGQKPFMCQVCSKGFIRKDHMVKHVQTHTRRNALHAHPPATAS